MFDLEKEFREWRKNLLKNPGIEENQVIEIQEELLEEIGDLVKQGLSEEEAFQRVTSEVAAADIMGSEFYKVRTTRSSGRPPWKAPRFVPVLLWNYYKVALRSIKRQKLHSLINVVGLSVAMACFLLILTFIQFENSYDRFFSDSDRIFRVGLRGDSPDDESYMLSTPEILSTTVETLIPEVEEAGITQRSPRSLLKTPEESFTEDGFFADADFLSLFSFELVSGDRSEALASPNSIVLTDRLAEKIFGDQNPIGQSLHFEGRFMNGNMMVTGIVHHPPKNTHLQFDFLVSAATMAAHSNLKSWFNSWNSYAFHTYIKLKQKQSKRRSEQKIQTLIEQARSEKFQRKNAVVLQPVTDIHLRSNVAGATSSNNRIHTVYLFGSIALIILLIASVNSMNLSTARATTRTKEVCMRKVVGARRVDLIKQFLGESYLFTILAMLFSIILFHTLFSVFSGFMGTNLILDDVKTLPLLLSVAGTILVVGAVSGLYPALVVSALQPQSFEKQRSVSWLQGIRIRNLLVVLQFTAVTVLMIGTIVITRQLHFIRHKNLGYDREHVVIMPLREEELLNKAAALKTSLMELSGIQAVTVTNSTPLRMASSVGGMEAQKENGETIKIDMHMAHADYDFLDVFGIRLAEGRNFSREFPSDRQAMLVNQALVRELGWRNPLNRKLNASTVIGVVEDFHFDTLHRPIETAAFYLEEDLTDRAMLGVRLLPLDPENTLTQIENVFGRIASGLTFDYYFLDDAYDRLYRNEQRLALMIGYLEGLAILLGCMGLFGLATYAAQRRSKEIGIRKVMGASVFSILRMMSSEFLVLVLISNLIAWPLGYYFLQRWLQGYAYRCGFGIETFLLAGFATLLIALAAVSLHTVRASLANPVESIRYE